MIALFRCVRPLPLRIVGGSRLGKRIGRKCAPCARSNSKRGKQWNITWPRLSRVYTGV